MVTKLEQLQQLYAAGKHNLIRDTWAALGSLKVSSSTKAYIQDTIFNIDLSNESVTGPLHGCLVYCNLSYFVGGDFESIEWASLKESNVERLVTTSLGITLPHFTILLTAAEMAAIKEPLDTTYVPYEVDVSVVDTDIDISDDELKRVLVECGVPYLRFDELEYKRSELCELFIRPALEIYFKYFPIIEQVEIGQFGAGQPFEFELPPYCYGASKVGYKQGGNIGSSNFGSGAMSFYRNEVVMSGQQGGWGRGVNYNKAVPGFVGAGSREAALLQRAGQQAYANYYKREKITYFRKDGKRYFRGYSTNGGILEAYLNFYSPHWDDIEFSQIVPARKLASAYALRGLGMLRSLIKADIPGGADFSLFNTRADALEKDVTETWAKLPSNFAVIQRG